VPEVSVAVPRTATPSRNSCAIPVAAEGVTTTMNVTFWPADEGFALDASAIDDAARMVTVIREPRLRA
jgi:hypothetical protein